MIIWDPKEENMIGKRIKDARLALGYSAEQVAAFLKVSPATVYRYENGDISKLPAKFIKPLAEYLCITPAFLMGWSSETNLSSDESYIVSTFRSLPDSGKEYLLQQTQIAKITFGEKPADISSKSV